MYVPSPGPLTVEDVLRYLQAFVAKNPENAKLRIRTEELDPEDCEPVYCRTWMIGYVEESGSVVIK